MKRTRNRQNKTMGTRPHGTKDQLPTILIVCEGTRTEPLYFDSFPLVSARVKAVGKGYNTDTLVQEAIRLKNLAIKERESFDQVWCVFDRDDFPQTNFERALQLALGAGIKVAYSNEAFEIWYLLHFDKIDSALSRKQYGDMLTKRLERKYEKNDPQIYSLIENGQKLAIRRAKQLLETYGEQHNPYSDNPCTTVFHLVEELSKYIK